MKFRLEEKIGRSHNGSVITELGIGNFKAFGDTQRVPIKPLTLIFGANSSGKSSIIHALLLAHHAMETGEYDVRQTKLAGDMVDLGGFRSYVHRHDSSKTVNLRLETDIDREALRQHLEGNAKEKAPFLKLSRFGLSLTVGGGDGLSAQMQQAGLPTLLQKGGTFDDYPTASQEIQRSGWPTHLLKMRGQEAVIERIAILIDGEEALTLSKETPIHSYFRVQAPSGSGSFLGQIVKRLAESSPAGPGREDSASRAAYYDLPGGEPAADAHALKETAERSRQQPASGMPSAESDAAQLTEALAEDITARCFGFRGLILRDDGYLKAIARERSRPWQAEAQVLSRNLAGLIEFCTARIAAGLRGASYLGPLRCVPPRDLAEQGVQDPRALAGSGLAWWKLVCQEPEVVKSVNRWLGPDQLRTPYRLKHRPLLDGDKVRRALEEGGDVAGRLNDYVDRTELLFEDLQSETVLTHRDIGFGVGQVLPVLVSASALRGHLIAVEQPELHLHPAQQAELGDVFIASALGSQRNTFLLETHSEHLILRIMRRIRETHAGTLPKGATPVTKKDVSILFVERDGARCIVREMPLNERGELVKAWPGGFFEEGFNEMF